jgi:membrane protein implicated in regulation of membrane protease activity
MDWWLWLVAGFVLLVLELVTPSGFFIMFFGVGALVAGALAATGLVTNAGLHSLVGEVVIPVEGIAPGAVGRVSLRGSNWEARNDGPVGVYANQRCKVVRVSGLQVGIVAE